MVVVVVVPGDVVVVVVPPQEAPTDSETLKLVSELAPNIKEPLNIQAS